MPNPIYVAIDTNDRVAAKTLAASLRDRVGGIKLGLEFFCAHGPAAVREVAGDLPLFLDLKLHDIPNTVAGAVRAVLPLKPRFLTVHASGGREMMRAAVEAANSVYDPPLLLGVTLLTSLPADPKEVLRLAEEARKAGLGGSVCSPLEVAALRAQVGPMVLVVPGIRPEGAERGDQARVATPSAAMVAGADVLVIGRPITQASDPVAAAQAITASLPGG